MFVSMFNIYFLAIFNYATLHGDLFTIGILFGAAELLGTLVGEPVIKKFPDWIAMIVSVIFVMVSCLVLRMPGVGQTTIYLVFLF